VEFLDAELGRAGLPALAEHGVTVTDTLKLARELHPGKRNSLDALCERYRIDNTHRTLHGALLDAELLAEVFLAMTRGQDSLAIELELPAAAAQAQTTGRKSAATKTVLTVLGATAAEIAEHERILAGIDKESRGRCVWLAVEGAPADPEPA
jgi:DNA polymerase-3 subunit epsilon